MSKHHLRADNLAKALFQTVPVALFYYDLDLKITDVNPQFVDMFESSRPALLGLDMHHLRDQRIVPTLRQAAEGTCGVYKGHYRATTSGAEVWLELQTFPLYASSGTLTSCLGIIMNITELTEKEQELFQSRQQLRALVESFDDIVFTLDNDLRHNAVFGRWVKKAGLTPDYFIGRRASEIFGRDRGKIHEDAARQALAGETVRYEWTMEVGSETRYYQTVLSPLFDASGEVDGVAGVGRDITAERKAAEELRLVNENLYVTLQSIGDAVISTDASGRVELMNPAAEELTGWTKEDAVGEPLEEVFHIVNESTGKPAENPVERVIAERKVVGLANHTMLIARNGARRSIADSAAPIIKNDDQLAGVVLVFRDVTAERQTSMALAASEERYRATFENTGTAMLIIEEDTTMSLVNHQCSVLTGYSSQELTGQSIRILFDETYWGMMREYHHRRRQRSRTEVPTQYESLLVCKNGARKIVLVNVELLPTGQSVVSLIDITARKKNEEEIKFLTFHDRITGLCNRTFVEGELRRLQNSGELVSIIIGDVNGLKLVNDAFGHNTGDKLLKQAAELLASSCRKNDLVARWGGDEFAILLPDADEVQAQMVIERIREKCHQATLEEVPISIALGLATRDRHNKDIYEVIQEAEEAMYRNKLLESRSYRNAVIISLEKTLLEKSLETEEHTLRLQQMSRRIGQVLDLTSRQLDELSLLAALHDIGKIAISEEIIKKPGPLTEEEFEEIKRHPEIGYRIALSTPELATVAELILSHHEWWNGQGYPRGLSGQQIPYLARIISILDAFDVMTHGRAYREALTAHQALDEISRCAGEQFDPKLAEVFINIVSKA